MFAIGEASHQSGVGIETIRYYEREGFVPKPARAANGRRVYTAEDIGRLRLLKSCRDLGFTLADARTLLDLSEARNEDCAAVRDLSERQLRDVRAKIAELRRLETALAELTANCASGNTRCPMLGALRAV